MIHIRIISLGRLSSPIVLRVFVTMDSCLKTILKLNIETAEMLTGDDITQEKVLKEQLKRMRNGKRPGVYREKPVLTNHFDKNVRVED
jgi:hypothetical protein